MYDNGQYGFNNNNQRILNSYTGEPTPEEHPVANIIITAIWFTIWWEIAKALVKKMWQHKISALVFFAGLYGIYLVITYIPQKNAFVPIWAAIITSVAGLIAVLRR